MSEIVPATQAMLEQASGRPVRHTTRALAVVEGDRLLGVAGVYADRGRMVMFANTLAPMRAHKRAVIRVYRTLFKWARERGWMVHAQACPTIEGSDILLEHLGFRHVPQVGLYVWNPHG